ncbi:Transcriptional regulator MET32 [Tolypocladium paradoxum]|uniref:Transcriptional regulator MET32 n=1 Tax=Tolypocladium paradoxum TaxID=94208 RepID=A0A2S4KPX0_9HYPO|nr:Transcriptional regulator MET32 [Tolypocladium paradoxum]
MANVELATCAASIPAAVPGTMIRTESRNSAAARGPKHARPASIASYRGQGEPLRPLRDTNLACRFRGLPDISAADYKHDDASKVSRHSSTNQSDAEISFLRGGDNAGLLHEQPSRQRKYSRDGSRHGATENSSPSLNEEDVAFIPWASPPFHDQSRAFYHHGDGFTSQDSKPSVPALTAGGFSALESFSKTIVRELSALHSNLSATDPSYGEAFDPEVAQSSHVRSRRPHAVIRLRGDIGGTGPRSGARGRHSLTSTGRRALCKGLPPTCRGVCISASGKPNAREPSPTRPMTEAVQAALLIHHIQFLMNNVETRRRNWSQRLPALVSAGCDVDNAGRLASKRPVPRPAEMRCDFPCPRELWDTQDVTEHDVESYRQQRLRSPHCLSSFSVSHPSVRLPEHYQQSLAISSVAVSAHLMSTLPLTSSAILRAISRWRELWETAAARGDRDCLQTTGMSRHCSEFCYLI